MRHRRQSRVLGGAKDRLERLRRIEVLLAAETDADDPTLAVLARITHRLEREVEQRAAGHIRCQAHLDAVTFPRLLRAVAEAGEDLVPVDPAPGRPRARRARSARRSPRCRWT
jgi:hypothetical protein